MRLPRTMTLPARNALMALPYWPEPPGPALMSSMRLSSTSVPSSPIAVRRISMPLSLVPRMVLRDTIRPCASNEVMPVTAMLRKNVAADIAGHILEPDAVAAAVGDLAIGDADVAAAEAMHEAAPRRQLDAAAVERDVGQAELLGAFAGNIDGPPVNTNLVAPRTPTSCVPLASRSMPVR